MSQLFVSEKKVTVTLRPYQQKGIVDTMAVLKDKNSVLFTMPTGSGKTVYLGHILNMCDRKGYRTLMMAHREELILQTRDRFLTQYGIETGVIKSGIKPAYFMQHQVGSVQTIIGKFDFVGKFDVLFIDECHHIKAKTYVDIVKELRRTNPELKVIGVTATPYRLSGEGFTDIFDEIVLGPTVQELEDDGSLMPAKILVKPIKGLSKLKMTGGDYNEKQLSEFMSDDIRLFSLVDTYIEKCDGKQMLVYATSIAHSKALLEAFRHRGIACEHIDGSSAMKNSRKGIIESFENKDIQVLCNVDIISEGNDLKGVEVIGDACPTKSLSRFLQRAGRGSRPDKRIGKEFYWLLDFANNVYEHGKPNKWHDWKEHFIGKPIGKKKKGEKPPKQFKIELETGEIVTRSFDSLPEGFRGIILEELSEDESLIQDIYDRFEGFVDVANVKGVSPMWAFHQILEYCAKNGYNAPPDGVVKDIAKKIIGKSGFPWSGSFAIDRVREIAQKYNLY